MNKGVAVLPTILIFGAVIMGLILTGVGVVQLVNRSTFSVRLASEARAAALAAADDVYIRILRGNISPEPAECNTFTIYDTLQFERSTAEISLCKNSCGLSVCGYQARIEAKSGLFSKQRLEVIFSSDPITGETRLASSEFVSFFDPGL